MKTADLVVSDARPASAFPPDGKRLLIYVVYDPRGDVEDYVLYALEHLRPHCRHIHAVVNGALTDRGRHRLGGVVDGILERENRGYDIWGYKAGLEAMAERMSEFDELLLVNDTWFGPVRSFEPVFERMDSRDLHFWGMTDHIRVEPHPFTGAGYLPYHLQSYWIAVRREMFETAEWRDYWRNLPEMNSYSDAVVKHEGVFTQHFTELGFAGEVAFPTLTDQVENHAVLYAEQLLDAGCPTLKRRPFFQWPPFLDAVAVVGRWTLDAARRYGYPVDLIYADLARNVAPKVANADAAMLEVVPDGPVAYDPSHPLRTLVVAHVYYVEMTEEVLARVEMLPGDYDMIITTPDAAKAQEIETLLSLRAERGKREVRVVPSNNGRDQGAFLIGCREELLGDAYDLVLKIHTKRTPQDGYNVGSHFKQQQFENLLHSPGYAANVMAMFQRQPGLGLAFPPMIHLGHPTMGHAWWANKSPFMKYRAQLGIRVPVDETSPLAPYGSMYFARPQALRILVENPWTYDDFGGAEAYDDGGLAHVLERMPAYAAGERGFHSRTIANRRYLADSYTALDFNLDQMSSTMPGNTMHQIEFLKQAGYIENGSFGDFASMYVRLHRPESEAALKRIRRRLAGARAVLRRMRHPRT